MRRHGMAQLRPSVKVAIRSNIQTDQNICVLVASEGVRIDCVFVESADKGKCSCQVLLDIRIVDIMLDHRIRVGGIGQFGHIVAAVGCGLLESEAPRGSLKRHLTFLANMGRPQQTR